jgi:hypothetical protein
MDYTVRYKNKRFSNEKVELDGKSFDHCEFDNCMMVVETGDTNLSGCRLNRCRLLLRGNAYTIGRIINLFSGKGPMKVVDFQEPLFEENPENPDGAKNVEGGPLETPCSHDHDMECADDPLHHHGGKKEGA